MTKADQTAPEPAYEAWKAWHADGTDDRPCPEPSICLDGFIAGYHARDAEVEALRKDIELAMAFLSDPEVIEGLKRALEQEQRGEYIPFSELRKRFGTGQRSEGVMIDQADQLSEILIGAIRARNQMDVMNPSASGLFNLRVQDISTLLAEYDRLTSENDILRANAQESTGIVARQVQEIRELRAETARLWMDPVTAVSGGFKEWWEEYHRARSLQWGSPGYERSAARAAWHARDAKFSAEIDAIHVDRGYLAGWIEAVEDVRSHLDDWSAEGTFAQVAKLREYLRLMNPGNPSCKAELAALEAERDSAVLDENLANTVLEGANSQIAALEAEIAALRQQVRDECARELGAMAEAMRRSVGGQMVGTHRMAVQLQAETLRDAAEALRGGSAAGTLTDQENTFVNPKTDEIS